MRREAYISDRTVIKRANAAVRIELEKNRALGIPTVIYDRESQIIYRENEDGTRTEVGKRMNKRSSLDNEAYCFCVNGRLQLSISISFSRSYLFFDTA